MSGLAQIRATSDHEKWVYNMYLSIHIFKHAHGLQRASSIYRPILILVGKPLPFFGLDQDRRLLCIVHADESCALRPLGNSDKSLAPISTVSDRAKIIIQEWAKRG